MTLTEIIEGHGPAVFADLETGVVITINGSYFNLWQPQPDGTFLRTERQSGHPSHPSLGELTVGQAMDLATAWFEKTTKDKG
jgi:hypothetical protein